MRARYATLAFISTNYMESAALHHQISEARIGITGMPDFECTLDYPTQEFPERLKIFTINAQIVREDNALTREEEGDDAKVTSLPSPALHDCQA